LQKLEKFMNKIISYFLQSILIYLFFFIGRLLGLKISRKLFSNLFLLIGPLFKSKKVVQKNLNIFSSKLSDKLKMKISNEMWKNYGKTFIEYVYLNHFRKKNFHVIVKGEENLNQIKNLKKPVIFVSGHFANFELMSMEITKKDIKLATIYRPLNNIFLNPFMEYLRKKYICKNQIKKGINGVRESINYLKKGYSIALMVDQRVSEGKKINFFGKPSLTTTLPAQLALKFNLKILPVFIERDSNDKFIIDFQKPLDAGVYKDKLHLSEKLNKILEEMIVKNPYQWIWTHNRWK